RRRAGADLLADGAPEPVRTVDLACEPDAVAVAAGDRERVAGREDPGPGDETSLDPERHLDHRVAPATKVPHRRHAMVERSRGVAHGLDRGNGVRRHLARLAGE